MTMMVPQETKEAIHYDPQKLGRLKDPVIVLRKVNIAKLQKRETPASNTAWELIGGAQAQLHLREDRLPWYAQGLIINDQPRDEKVARDIVNATIGFAVARSDTGEILQTWGPDGLSDAIATAASVKLTIVPKITKVAPNREDDQDALVQEFLSQMPNAEIPEAQQE